MTIYAIRRRSLLNDIAALRAQAASAHQLRMELAALRSCRVLVS